MDGGMGRQERGGCTEWASAVFSLFGMLMKVDIESVRPRRRSLAAGVYGEIPTAESDALEPASQFGRSRLCGAESQLCGGDVLGSLFLSAAAPPVCLSPHLTDLSLVKIRKGKPRSLIRGPTRPKSKGERREDLPRRDPAAVSRAPLFFPSPLPPLLGDKPRPWPGGVCYLRGLNK